MPRAAGRVDQLHLRQTKRIDGPLKRAIEQEGFHEIRRLQQRITLARSLRKILVQIAEKTRIELRRHERQRNLATLRIALAQHVEQSLGPVRRRRQPPKRRRRLAEEAAEPRQMRHFPENPQHVFALARLTSRAIKGPLLIARQLDVFE